MDPRAPGWLNRRRYGLPAWMHARATERRLAGDWRGACAAAHVDVDIDLTRVGSAVAERLADDLAHLVPDLLRWHFPRTNDGDGAALRTGPGVRLATYGRLALTASAPDHWCRPQRLVLRLRRSTDEDAWESARHLWDVRRTEQLRMRTGGGTDRTPFFRPDGTPLSDAELPKRRPGPHDRAALTEWTTLLDEAGEVVRAWEDAGCGVDNAVGPLATEGYRPRVLFTSVAGAALHALSSLRDQPRRAVLAGSGDRRYATLIDLDGDRPTARVIPASEMPHHVRLPAVRWERPPDLDLLRAGLIGAEALHPLVRAALFPRYAAPQEYRPPAADAPALPLTVQVPCRGERHDVVLADGTTRLPAHTPEELARERTLAALGGRTRGCEFIPGQWPEPVPRAVRLLRRHAELAMFHGDAPELRRLLDSGLDPALVADPERGTLLHLLGCVDRRDAAELARRLVAAGTGLEERDAAGRTPLLVLVQGGSVEAVRALLDAGADPHAVTVTGATALHAVRGTDAAAIVALLTSTGLSVESLDAAGETPLQEAIATGAPVHVTQALLDAGADPGTSPLYPFWAAVVAGGGGDAEVERLARNNGCTWNDE